mgnify:CR=1 FL=1
MVSQVTITEYFNWSSWNVSGVLAFDFSNFHKKTILYFWKPFFSKIDTVHATIKSSIFSNKNWPFRVKVELLVPDEGPYSKPWIFFFFVWVRCHISLGCFWFINSWMYSESKRPRVSMNAIFLQCPVTRLCGNVKFDK